MYDLLQHSTTTAARLLEDNGLTLATNNREVSESNNFPKITRFSLGSQYVLEIALQSARLKQKKYIETEHILLGLVQLAQTENKHLTALVQQYEVNIASLTKNLTEII